MTTPEQVLEEFKKFGKECRDSVGCGDREDIESFMVGGMAATIAFLRNDIEAMKEREYDATAELASSTL